MDVVPVSEPVRSIQIYDPARGSIAPVTDTKSSYVYSDSLRSKSDRSTNDRLAYEIDSVDSPERSLAKPANFPDRNGVRLVHRCRCTLNAASLVYVPQNALDASS